MNPINYDSHRIYPSKVVCVGRNYAEHIAELNNETPDKPVIFLKPNSAISGEIMTDQIDQIHFEGEISFLIFNGEISAVGFGLDLTKREIQSQLKSKGLPWERAKAFDKSAVFSEFVPITKGLADLRMELERNGKLVQHGGVNQMLNAPIDLFNEVASFMSWEDGDILMTGTPKGVGIVKKNDVFIGRLYNAEQLLITQKWRV